MESNTFIVGKVTNTPQIIRNGDVMRIAFSVTETETGKIIPVIADTSRSFYDRIKSSSTIEITGTACTRKMTVSGKVKFQRTVLAHSFSVEE